MFVQHNTQISAKINVVTGTFRTGKVQTKSTSYVAIISRQRINYSKQQKVEYSIPQSTVYTSITLELVIYRHYLQLEASL